MTHIPAIDRDARKQELDAFLFSGRARVRKGKHTPNEVTVMTNYIKASGKTAIARKKASAPMRFLIREGWIDTDWDGVLDYGCGKGADVDAIREHGGVADGYDPNHNMDVNVLRNATDGAYDVITCTYVANTLPLAERIKLYETLRALRCEQTFITVRKDIAQDGWTSEGTYQETVRVDQETDAVLVKETSAWAMYWLKSVKPRYLHQY